jgi:XdhC and CoxI family
VSLQSEFADIAAADGRAALVTVIAGPAIGAKLLVRADGSTDGGLGAPELDAVGVEAAEELLWAERSETREAGETKLFVDVVAPAPPAGARSCATRARSSPPPRASRTPRR